MRKVVRERRQTFNGRARDHVVGGTVLGGMAPSKTAYRWPGGEKANARLVGLGN